MPSPTPTPTNSGRPLRHRGPARARRRALAIMDRLPQPLRHALHEALFDWDPRWARAELDKRLRAARRPDDAVASALRMITAGDETELWSFAQHWPVHVRAGASLQRYEAHHG